MEAGVSRFAAVVFDLFGTLVYEFPREDWDEWLETTAAVLEAEPEAFAGAWHATAIERQTQAEIGGGTVTGINDIEEIGATVEQFVEDPTPLGEQGDPTDGDQQRRPEQAQAVGPAQRVEVAP